MKGLPIFPGQAHERFCTFEEGAQLIFISNVSGRFGLGGIAKSVSDRHGICFFFHYRADFPQKLVYSDIRQEFDLVVAAGIFAALWGLCRDREQDQKGRGT